MMECLDMLLSICTTVKDQFSILYQVELYVYYIIIYL